MPVLIARVGMHSMRIWSRESVLQHVLIPSFLLRNLIDLA